MYSVGDLILYGSTGVCKVTDIITRNQTKTEDGRLFYVLTPLYQHCLISAPVNSTKVFMRPIISKEEANHLIDRIPSIRAEAYQSRALSELAAHYKASLSTHDCSDLMELTMSIYAKKQLIAQQKRKLGAVDEKFMKRAEELLFGELAAALDIPIDQVTDYIKDRIGMKPSGATNES